MDIAVRSTNFESGESDDERIRIEDDDEESSLAERRSFSERGTVNTAMAKAR